MAAGAGQVTWLTDQPHLNEIRGGSSKLPSHGMDQAFRRWGSLPACIDWSQVPWPWLDSSSSIRLGARTGARGHFHHSTGLHLAPTILSSDWIFSFWWWWMTFLENPSFNFVFLENVCKTDTVIAATARYQLHEMLAAAGTGTLRYSMQSAEPAPSISWSWCTYTLLYARLAAARLQEYKQPCRCRVVPFSNQRKSLHIHTSTTTHAERKKKEQQKTEERKEN